jgi:hypothetical protein
MQRDYRFTLGEEMKKELIALILNIYRANCRTDKKELILNAREHSEIVRMLLRLSNDLKQLPLRDFIVANEYIESISKQLTAWSNIQKG